MTRWLGIACVLLLLAACAPPLVLTLAAGPQGAPLAQTAPPAPTLPLSVAPAKTEVLQPVTITAAGLPADRPVTISWQTVEGGWHVVDYYRFLGKKFQDATRQWGEARTDADGQLSVTLNIPEDYGGVHNVIASVDGVPVARGGVEVVQSFAISRTEGPIGSSIEITARGLGWQTMESTW